MANSGVITHSYLYLTMQIVLVLWAEIIIYFLIFLSEISRLDFVCGSKNTENV